MHLIIKKLNGHNQKHQKWGKRLHDVQAEQKEPSQEQKIL